MKLKYILYARKSTQDEGKQVQSLEDQLTEMNRIAERDSLQVVYTLQEARSAKLPGTRPEFKRMIDLLESGEANAVLTYSTSRLSRNPVDSGLVQHLLQQENIRHIKTSNRDYYPDDNAVVFAVDSSVSNEYLLNLKREVVRGIKGKARRGGIGGVAPQGYINDIANRAVLPDPERFDSIRYAWDLLLTGEYSVPHIQTILNERLGYRSLKRKLRGGQPMSRSALYAIFSNPRYAGKVQSLDAKGEFYEGNYPPMITEDEYNQAQLILGKRGKPRLTPHKRFELRGLMKCGECGCNITAHEARKKLKSGRINTHVYYRCTGKRPCSQKSSIKEELLHSKVLELLNRYELSDELYKWSIKALDDLSKKEESGRSISERNLTKSIEQWHKQLDNLLELVSDGTISSNDYTKKCAELKSKISKAQKDRSDHSRVIFDWHQEVATTLNVLHNATTQFSKSDILNKKTIMAAIGQNPVLLNGELLITPNRWLIPVVDAQLMHNNIQLQVETEVNRSQKNSPLDKEATLESLWYTRQDLNL